jgi:CheY-like chemotaxis protein
MDIVLKGKMDGIETAKQFRSRFDIPVVYLSAYSDEKTLERAKQTDPFGYVIKPYREKELHVNIEMSLYKHKMEKEFKPSDQKLENLI